MGHYKEKIQTIIYWKEKIQAYFYRLDESLTILDVTIELFVRLLYSPLVYEI